MASHCGQVQDLTSRGLLPELNPNAEHSPLEGNQRLTLTTVRLQRSAFSSSSRTDVDQQASWTDLAGLVRARPDTARSCTWVAWLSQAMR